MPTTSVITVKSSGGDYSSLATAEAGEQTNLVTADVQLDIECYAMEDTSAVAINGWTTDATRYLRIVAPAAERHDGKWNTAKYRLTNSAEFTRTLSINEDFVRVEGLQVEHTNGNGVSPVEISSTANAASSDVRISDCVVRSSSTRTGGAGSGIYQGSGKLSVQNTVVYKAGGSGVYTEFSSNSPTTNLDNCTIAACGEYGVSSGGTMTLRNIYCGGNGTDAYSGSMTRTTCAHSSATVFGGSTASVAHSTANFVSITSGSEDYHLVSGSALIDAGTDLSGTFTTDIDGNTRSGTWDIGADEFQGGGGGGFSAFLASVAQTQVIIGGGFYSF